MSYHPNLTKHTSRVLNPSPLKKQIHSLAYFDTIIPKNISLVAEKLRTQCLDIYEVLKPLEKMGINFDLWLVGGSVRDLLLKKSELISDLDICISFKSHSIIRQISAQDFLKHSKLKAEDFPLLAWKDGDRSKPAFSHWNAINKKVKFSKKNSNNSENEKAKTIAFTHICYEMLYCLLANNFDLYQSFAPYAGKSNLYNQYAGDRIDGVLKLRSPKWSWNCDILITKEHPQKFVDSFDFGICKVGIELVKSYLRHYNIEFFPQNIKDLFLRIHFTDEFLTDIKAKKHIIRLENQASLSDIQRSLENHLPKISLKYDWPVVFKAPVICRDDESGIDKIEEKINFVNSFLRKEKLEIFLGEKTTSVVKLLKI